MFETGGDTMTLLSGLVRTMLVLVVSASHALLSCSMPIPRHYDSKFTVDSILQSEGSQPSSGRATIVVRFNDLCNDPLTQGMLLEIFLNKRTLEEPVRTLRSSLTMDVEVSGDSVSVSGRSLYRLHSSAWTKNVFLTPGDTVYMTFHSGGVCDGYEKYRRFPK